MLEQAYKIVSPLPKTYDIEKLANITEDIKEKLLIV